MVNVKTTSKKVNFMGREEIATTYTVVNDSGEETSYTSIGGLII